MPVTLDQIVAQVAAEYDYAVRREGRVFILNKLYSNPNDLPAMTWTECQHSFEQTQQAAEPFNPHVGRDHPLAPSDPNFRIGKHRFASPLVDPLAASLTSAQLDAMREKKLHISSLSADQQALARRILTYLYLQHPLDIAKKALPALQRIQAGAVFTRQDIGADHQVFGYTLPKTKDDVIPFHPLSQFNGWEDLSGLAVAQSSAPLTGTDPTGPGLDKSTSMTVANGDGRTLADVLNALKGEPPGSVDVSIDQAVSTKPVLVAGLENVSPNESLRSLTDLYGLRLESGKLNGRAYARIDMGEVHPPLDIIGLPLSLRQTLPLPFMEAVHLGQVATAEQQIYKLLQPRIVPKITTQIGTHTPTIEETQTEMERAIRERKESLIGPEQFTADENNIKQSEYALALLRFAAIRRLRALVEPKLQSNSGSVPLAALGEPEHEAMAIIVMVEEVQAIIKPLTSPIPNELVNFNQLVLCGGIYGDEQNPQISILFGFPSSDGKVSPHVGVSDLDYNK